MEHNVFSAVWDRKSRDLLSYNVFKTAGHPNLKMSSEIRFDNKVVIITGAGGGEFELVY